MLRGRFHPEAPDDVQVVVHDGGPKTSAAPEMVWVRVTGAGANNVFRGTVLNDPQQLETVRQGASINFVAPEGGHLLMVTGQYIAEREEWVVQPCSKCGLDELFDPPSLLVEQSFGNIEDVETMEAVTTRCGLCGGTQVVALANVLDAEAEPRKKWWRFWR